MSAAICLFLKAAASQADLFDAMVPVQGFTRKDGTTVKPHMSKRKKRGNSEKPEAIPRNVKNAVRALFGVLRTIADGLNGARKTDGGLNGGGRYQGEALSQLLYAEKGVRAAQAIQKLHHFEKHAKEKGIDPQVLYNELGGMPEIWITKKGAEYAADIGVVMPGYVEIRDSKGRSSPDDYERELSDVLVKIAKLGDAAGDPEHRHLHDEADKIQREMIYDHGEREASRIYHRAVKTQDKDDGDDWRAGPSFYVTVIDNEGNGGKGRYTTLAGPFKTHQEALDMVRVAKDKAQELDPRAAWYAFGTSKLETGEKEGQLNSHLGITVDSPAKGQDKPALFLKKPAK